MCIWNVKYPLDHFGLNVKLPDLGVRKEGGLGKGVKIIWVGNVGNGRLSKS